MTDTELLETPDSELSAGLYYKKYKLNQARIGSSGGARVNLVPEDELYGIFTYYEKSRKSPNQLVKHVRAEGLKLSNERSRIVFDTFTERYNKEKEND